MNTLDNKELSIQVNLNGLSFCILNTTTRKIEFLNTINFVNKLTHFDVLNRLKTELSANSRFFETFKAVQLIHHNELASLVPKSLYDTTQKVNYLKFNAKILKTDYISEDYLDHHDSVNVYIPYVNINNYIFETFGEFTYKHSSTLLIDTVLKTLPLSVSPKLCIHVSPHLIEVMVLQDGQLQLFNVFEYYTKEDFIYYVLFVFEQLNLDVETTEVLLAGAIDKDSKLYNTLYTYIREVNFIRPNFNFNFEVTNDKHALNHHYLLLNSF